MLLLSKLLPLLVYPLSLACLLLLVLACLRGLKGWQRGLLIAALLLLWLGGNRWVAFSLQRSLEWQYLPEGPLPQADAIVLLGGATEPQDPPRPIVEINGAGDRVLYAAALYHAGLAPAILVSGGRLPWESNPGSTPAEEMSAILQNLGVPAEAIWLEPRSRNTEENAAYSLPILREHGAESILLVTSAFHMPRSVALFEQPGMEVTPAPTDFTITEVEWQALMHPDWENIVLGLFPQSGYLNMTTSCLKEYIGRLYYGVRESLGP